MEIEIQDFVFELLPQKAVWWRAKDTLLITDLHLGKILHFRKAGIALPQHAFEFNFRQLDAVLEASHPERIIFLGDLFHHQVNEEWKYFQRWHARFMSLEMIAVLGNHDILPVALFDEINIRRVPFLEEDGFLFRHHPIAEEKNHGPFTFCGHVHPMFQIQSPTSHSLRLPCFVLESHQMILPSFGLFTGGFTVQRKPGRQIFIIADSLIFEIP